MAARFGAVVGGSGGVIYRECRVRINFTRRVAAGPPRLRCVYYANMSIRLARVALLHLSIFYPLGSNDEKEMFSRVRKRWQ